MLDIVVLYFLTKRVGQKAIRKGLEPGRWKLYAILAWFGLLIVGVFIGAMLSENLLYIALVGYVCAVGGYLIVKYNMDKYPDKSAMDDWIEHIGEKDN